MSKDNKTIESNVAQVDIDLDEMFNPGVGADSVTLPEGEDEETKKKSIFSKPGKTADFSFTEPKDGEDEEEEGGEGEGEGEDEVKKPVSAESKAKSKEEGSSLLDELTDDEEDGEEEGEEKKKQTRGRKPISGMSDVFTKLIKEDKIVPFDDDKDLSEYSAKDWEELIEANLEERANQVRRETPKQFFDSLPKELQTAARYVADGGTDLKGLFSTLAQSEETKSLDITKEKDQEQIIKDYLSATDYGTVEEIAEEIEIWKDLGKLEQQASKFKPKLDKMQEKVVAKKLKEQEARKQQQEQASQQYMENVYNTLKEGALGDVKLDKKTQAMLYNGLVQPNYPSVSGRNTNLLGHLLEKYQFVEPNYTLISEALWLLSDPDGYKSKIMDKGAQKSVESTVRKLKTEQSNAGGSSLGVEQQDSKATRTTSKKKISRPSNIFKRF